MGIWFNIIFKTLTVLINIFFFLQSKLIFDLTRDIDIARVN